MNKQHNDQDDQQAQTSGGAKKGGSSGRRSRRYSKSDAASQHDSQSTQQQELAASTTGTSTSSNAAASTGAESKPASDASAGSKSSDKPADKSDDTSSSAAPTAAAASAAKPASASSSASSTASKSASASGKGSSGKGSSGKGSSGKSGVAGNGSGSGRGDMTPATPSSGGGKAGAVALALVIALGAGGGYFGWQLWQKQEAHDQALATLPEAPVSQSALDALKGQLQSGEQQRDQAMDSTIDGLRSEFTDYRTSVDGTLDKVLMQLSQTQDTDERDWLHAEAAYLLRLANQRLQLERDVGGAAALLHTADKRLLEADNPALVPVRREIASELAALESVPKVDRTGLYLALNAQQERIGALPLSQNIEEMVADAQVEEAPTGGWKSQLSTFGNELKGLVTVRNHDEALEALISPEQESYLRQSLRLVLEQSQLAMLKEEQDLYDASLDKALTLIDGYYDTDDAGVKSVVERLEQLKGEKIHPKLPDISGSQQALNRFIQQRFEAGSSGKGDNA